jgi:hypothetical protein
MAANQRRNYARRDHTFERMNVMTEQEPRRTRFAELGYRCDGPSLWRIYDITDTPQPVGPQYRTKAELLADLDRYAKNFGCG